MGNPVSDARYEEIMAELGQRLNVADQIAATGYRYEGYAHEETSGLLYHFGQFVTCVSFGLLKPNAERDELAAYYLHKAAAPLATAQEINLRAIDAAGEQLA